MVARFLGFMGLTCELIRFQMRLARARKRSDQLTTTVLAFSGICFCLWTLGRATWTVKQIIWLMLQIWVSSRMQSLGVGDSAWRES
jgi:energy-converting hydrogenase Eha subunit G